MIGSDIAGLASYALTFCTKNFRAWGRRHGAYERRAFVEAVMNRLRQHYAERTPLPGDEDEQTLSLAQLQRLYRYVLSEGYGE